MNKSVLIVTPFFAPQSHAPVFRMHKLAKYLPEYGWKPYVLTVDTNYTYNEDPGLLDELPPEVEICRTRYIEPTLRGLRMVLGGKDRTFSAQKEAVVEKENNNLSTDKSVNSNGIFSKVYNYMLNWHLKNPDAFWSWRITALKKAKKLIRKHGISIVLTTFPPHSSFEIGLRLKKELGIKWVADFRDPGSFQARNSTSSKAGNVLKQRREMERLAIEQADFKIVTSKVYPLLFQEMYNDTRENYLQIPTGIDDKLLPAAQEKKEPWIVFVGEYLEEYGSKFLVTLDEVMNKEKLPNGFKFLIIGHEEINRSILEPMINGRKLKQYTEFYDHMPQEELYKKIKRAKAAILIPGKQTLFSCNFAKMVDYIGLQIPVLADVPEISEARNELSKAGLGIFLDGTKKEDAEKMAAFINGEITATPDSEYCQKYLASKQVKIFGEVLNKVIDKH